MSRQRAQTGGKTRSGAGRFFVLALTLAVFVVLCGAIAARPWRPKASPDPHLALLSARERKLQHESIVVRRLVVNRWALYRRQLKRRRAEIAAAREKHEQELAAAAAAARAAAAAASTTSYAVAAPSGGFSSTGSTRVVTLPPRVTVVNLPPVTSTGTS